MRKIGKNLLKLPIDSGNQVKNAQKCAFFLYIFTIDKCAEI